MGHQKQDVAAALFNGQYSDRDPTGVACPYPGKEKRDEEEAMPVVKENAVGNEGGRHPLQLLPEEIWEVIFGKLKNSPKALVACCTASSTWDSLLSIRKTTWLFEEIFPFLFPYLKNGDILKCRQLCKAWRNSVDKHIENHPCHHPSAPDNFDDGDNRRESVYYPLIKKKLHQIRFNDTEELTEFRLQMEHSSRNPIIGRSVCFYARPQDEWMLNGLHFLSEFGKHIWYFSFETFHLPVTMVKWLRQCLSLLPNLKKLRVYSTLNQHTFDVNTNPELLNELLQEIIENPFPTLPALETLEIFAKSLPNVIQDTLLSTYAGKMQRLEVDDWNDTYVNAEAYPLSDLKELTLKIDSNEVLENLAHFNAPVLRKLALFFRYREIDLSSLSEVLWQFRENLRVLKITLSATSSFKMVNFLDSFLHLVFPKLKVLVLVNAEDLPYNFVRGMKSLEYLHFEKWRRCEVVSKDPLSFVQMKGYIPSSTTHGEFWVWDKLPELKRLTYHDLSKEKLVITRNIYEHKRKLTSVL